jgi:FtsH ternary system domain X6
VTNKPRVVSKFEGRLIGLARAIVRLSPIDAALPFLLDKITIPPAYSPDCLQLVCDSLAKGCVLYLAKTGGWRSERFLHGDQPVEGRLWDRVPTAERQLAFSRHVFNFLVWLTAHDPVLAKPWYPPAEELTVADRLVIFLAYDGFRDTKAGPSWRHRPIFARNVLCRLMWPGDFAGMTAQPPDFAGWGGGLAASILEVLQVSLSERWLAVEHGKSEIGEWISMRQLAEAQDLVLDHFLPAIDPKRRDLARFLIRAAASYCSPGVRGEHLTTGLGAGGATRLAERFAIRRQAAVLARVLDRLAMWERQSRFVGYLDEGYQIAQFFLSEWDAAGAGPALIRARDLLRQLRPLAGGGGTDEPGIPSERERVGTTADSRDR